MTKELPRHLALTQLRLRSITAGLDVPLSDAFLLTLMLTADGARRHEITINRFACMGAEPRSQTFSIRDLVALARLESDSPHRAPIREKPPRLSAPPPAEEARLNRLTGAVRDVMMSRDWCTLLQIQTALDDQGIHAEFPAISARIRDLRKAQFGGHTVDREGVPGKRGLFRYRLTLRTPA